MTFHIEEKRNFNNSDMKKECNFSGGARGKHYKAYRKGHTVIVHKDDGSASVQYFTQEDGSVMLDPDVKVHFPDSESVNKALRSLMLSISKFGYRKGALRWTNEKASG